MAMVVALFDSLASTSLQRRAITCACSFVGCLLVVVAFMSLGRAHSVQDTSKEKSFQVERGITGTLNFSYPGKPIQAKAQRDIDAPFNVRVYSIDSKSGRYEARYLATIVGEYDLRDWVEHSDGSPVSDFPSLPIRVISTLPKDQRSDLFEAGIFNRYWVEATVKH